jgi:hypothetical protein
VIWTRKALYVVVATVVIVVSACGANSDDPPDTVEGIVSEVTGDLTTVESLVIMDADGNSHLFKPTSGLLFYGAPLSHLRDHVVTGQRVAVTFDIGAYGERIAILIEHAEAESAHEHGE